MDPYIRATESNDINMVCKLLDDGLNVHYNDEDGNTI
jgi:hypothetical protein